VSIKNGVLYLVATPIGNLDDISARAIETLSRVSIVAAEDTRHSRILLRHYGVDTRMLALHEHNERQALEKVIGALRQGESVALVSDAGTPLISDPGFPLVRECHRQGITVSPVPGASAAIAALSASGLATDRFVFEGFPPRNQGARKTLFQDLIRESRTMVFYESSHRVQACLQDMAQVFGPDRPAVLARELTKLHETILHETLGSLCDILEQDPMQSRGEFVLLVGGEPERSDDALAPEVERTLQILMQELPLKQAAALASRLTGEKKNRLYQLGLGLQDASRD
jgi:16S rRNA (cytidine1402-2'-O)-methyltransferase